MQNNQTVRYRFRLKLLMALCIWMTLSSVSALEETLVSSNALCRYLVPLDGTLGTSWAARNFDDSLWSPGASGLGYDKSSTYLPLFGAVVPRNTLSFYVRYSFQVRAEKNFDILKLRMKYDDGFIAYLNGARVACANAPPNADFTSSATTTHKDSLALVYQDFDISAFAPLLVTGANALAVHALNASSTSSDLLILPELIGGSEVVTNVAINEFMAINDTGLANSLGGRADWIELYNPFTNSVSLSGWYLSDNASKLTKWQFPVGPESVIAAKGHLLIWADGQTCSVTNGELHASFKLSGGGEFLGLVKPDGATVAYAYYPEFPAQYSDVSYGIGENGEHRYFAVPTPGAVNLFAGGSNKVSAVRFSPKRGVHTNAIPVVTATTPTAEAEIRYSVDGCAPTIKSALYSGPLRLSQTTVIRGAGFRSGFAPSAIDTHSYISVDDVLRQPEAPAGFPDTWRGTTNGAAGNFEVDYAMDAAIVETAGAALTNALKALPSVSIVTSLPNLFDPTTGIYVNPTERGMEWERLASAEWIMPDNTSRFQVDCGLRIQGGRFRLFEDTAKKSFSLRFRKIYGKGRLKEKLFSGNAVESFNDLVLRGGATDSWSRGVFGGHEKTQFIVDEFVRRRHLAVGGVCPHGTFVHLYLNGLYWGLYNVTEKVSGDFAADYLGGRDDTWDVLKQRGLTVEGDFTVWNALVNRLSTDPGSNATYQRVQGNNPDGVRNLSYPIYLDVGNYIDYMVVQYWSANSDWPGNNWRAFRDRNEAFSTGFKFAVWDAEFGLGIRNSFWDANRGDALLIDQTGSTAGVAALQGKLVLNAEYRLRFADRAHKHLFNGGELTPAVTVPRYQALAAQVEPAIVAESARWGDQDGKAAHTLTQWRTQRDYVLNTFLTERGARLIQHFRKRGLYPNVTAPVFSQFGGLFKNGLNLTIMSEHPVYYTIDGSDPRQYGTSAAVGIPYTNGVVLTRTTRVKARALTLAGEWSALSDAVFTLSEMPDLRITELMYHPSAPVSSGDDVYLNGYDEFIEIQNAGLAPVGLSGLHFARGVAFDFKDGAVEVLNPGEYVLVVKDFSAFTNRYPAVTAAKIAGIFTFPSRSLSNDGEKIELRDALGRTVISLTYSNTWLPATDGAGHSLVPLPDVAQADGQLDYPGNWRASVYIGGSPGEAEPATPVETLKLNEILACADNDGIELYNAGFESVTLGAGWYLSDDPSDLKKWEIPAESTVAAQGWIYFYELRDFNASPSGGFGLSKTGEQVLLSHLTGTDQDRVVDALAFGAQERDKPLVRYPDGARAWFKGVSTPGASNRLAGADIQIAEVLYHPAAAVDDRNDSGNCEFVELFNPTARAVTLMRIEDDAGAWRLAGDIYFLFPDNTIMPAGGRLVVLPFDPVADETRRDAFLSAYELSEGQIHFVGPYSGKLNNKTGTICLERPVHPDASGENAAWHTVDKITYYDAAPWPSEADGTGRPLTRLPGRNSADDPASWKAGLSATPGRAPAKVAVTFPADNSGVVVPSEIKVTAEIDPCFTVGEVSGVVFAVDGVDRVAVSSAPYEAPVVLEALEGERRITARLTDGEGDTTSASVSVMAYTNIPSFSAGLDQSVNLMVTNSVNLRGALTVGSGMTNPVQVVWSCPDSPSVVIQNSARGHASASFTKPGRYDLMLTMTYGWLVTNRFMTVTVTDANTFNRIPYRENFEGYEPGSPLVGVGGWYGAAADAATITSNRYAGSVAGGYPIRGSHRQGLAFKGGVSNLFEETSSLTNICLDMLLACESGASENPPEVSFSTQLAFWVNRARRLMVWHGEAGGTNRWSELPDISIATNAFARLTVMADYGYAPQGSFGFRIWINRQPVTSPKVWFASANTNRNFFSGITLEGGGQADDLVVDPYNSMLYRRITSLAGAHGAVAPAGECFVPVGTSTNILIQPDRFYGVGAVRVDGSNVGPARNYEFANVWDEHNLEVDFLANLTGSGVPEIWLNRINPAWTNNFDEHERKDSDGDGMNNAREYVAGTDATNAQSVFRLDFDWADGISVVSFPTVLSGGFHGLGGVRRYALEWTDDLAGDNWRGVTGLTNVAGEGQSVIHTNRPNEAARRFFRGRVWIDP